MYKKLIVASFIVCVSLMVLVNFGSAGSNALTKHEYDATDKVGFFDLVVSLDWEPTATEKSGKLKTAFEQFAKDTFKMSEGKQKIRKIYVYTDGKQMNTADIQFLDKGGRSNAYSNSIFDKGGRILTYTGFSSGSARPDTYIGHTIAHEFAHYALGLYDEYEGSAASSTRPSKPLDNDTPKDTIMHRQGNWQWLSIASDYAVAAERKTAQWRVYECSAWETLLKSPSNDKTHESWRAGFARVRYEEFDGMALPTNLTKPAAGWDSDFEIIYKGGNVAVLVIDKSGSMGWDTPPAMDSAISAAKQFVDLLNIGDKVAVVAFDSGAYTTIGVTDLVDQAAKNTVKSAIDTLAAGGGTNFTAALDQALDVFAASSTQEDTRYVVMVSDGEASEPNVQSYIDQAIPVYTIGLSVPANGATVLNSIASKTGGSYRAAPTNLELADLYAEINRDILGRIVVLAKWIKQLITGEVSEEPVTITDQEDLITFRASWDVGDTMAFTLKMPDGTVVTPGSLPAGVNYVSGSEYGLYTVENPQAGEWKSVVTATSVSTSGSVSQEVSGDSSLSVQLKLYGGVDMAPIAIMATVAGPESVLEANVKAIVTAPSGADPIPDIVLHDDGISPDLEPDDGIYSGVLPDYDTNGVYKISVDVNNDAGLAYLDTSGALEDGVDAPPEALPEFQRYTEENITVSGYDSPPQSAFAAIEVPIDNTKVWGMIPSAGDVVWYKFTPISGEDYFISTNNLLSWDASTMATKLTLYDTDGTTVLSDSSNDQLTNVSLIEWTALSSDTYYLTVEHAASGTGSFAVTVGDTDVISRGVDSDADPTSGDSDDTSGDSGGGGGADTSGGGSGGGGGGGCFIGTLLF
jgi:calcium-activated chloride channel regulator 3/4